MPAASLAQLLNVRSRFADEVVAFCDAAVQVLDATPFHYRDPNAGGGSRTISISGTVIDARVFTEKLAVPERDGDAPGPPRRRNEDDTAPANEHEKKLADLNEQPWRAEGRESILWSRALARARAERPLVVRGAPGGGKTTLSRYSVIKRLMAVRDDIAAGTKLVEECEPMLWTTCTAFARAQGAKDDPAGLVIAAAADALDLPAAACSERVRSWLRTCIAGGKCPLVLDSLDEVAADDEHRFRDRAPRLLDLGSPLVLTCRVLEWTQWQDRLRWRDLELIELAPLTAREQRDYARRFFEQEIARPGLVAGFRGQLTRSPALRKACESPILLFFACLLHGEGELEDAATRTDLYELMSRRLFRGEWRGHTEPPAWADDGAREFHVIAWLGEIALALFRAAPETKEFPLSAWEAAIGHPDAAAAAGSVHPTVHPGDLLADLGRCGFLVPTGWKIAASGPKKRQPHYCLPHRSFLAYLAGAALAQRPREVWLAEAIAHLWFQPAWEDVVFFLAGHLDEADADALLDEVEKQPEDIFRQRLRWQWRIAGETKAIPARWGELWTDAALMLAREDEKFCTSEAARDDLLRSLAGAVRVAPQSLEALLPLLDPARKSDRDVRMSVIKALGQIGGDRALEALLQSLDPARETASDVRNGVAWALGQIGGDRALEALLQSLDPVREPDSRVRDRAAEALGKIGSVRAVDALLQSLDPARETAIDVRRGVARALGQIGGDRTLEALLQSLDPARETASDVRNGVAWALGQIGGDRALDALLPRLDPGRETARDVRRGVVGALGQIGSERAVEALLPRLDPVRETASDVRYGVAWALGQIGGDRALEALLQSLDPVRETANYVRNGVALALGQIGSDRALEALLRRLDSAQESVYSVRWCAADALFKIHWRLGDRTPFLMKRRRR